jgi:hypothetical protein
MFICRTDSGACSEPGWHDDDGIGVRGVEFASYFGKLASSSIRSVRPAPRPGRTCRRRPSGARPRAPATGASWLPVLAGRGGRGPPGVTDRPDGNASRCPSRKAMSSLTSGISQPAANTAIALAPAWPSPIGARLDVPYRPRGHQQAVRQVSLLCGRLAHLEDR